MFLFSEGDGSQRELLGGKGANLAEMTRLGLPVPRGLFISTEACTRFYEDGKVIGDDILSQLKKDCFETENYWVRSLGMQATHC